MKIGVKISPLLKKQLGARLAAEEKRVLDAAVEALQEATPVDTGYAESRWTHDGKHIINDAEYIARLNEGHSEQAPAYFVEQTLLSQKGIVPSGTIVRSE